MQLLSELVMDNWLAIICGTFASEDLTCITVGLLIREHGLSPFVGVTASFLGIYFGDLGLWLAGRLFGSRILQHRWISAHLPVQRLDRLGEWIDRQGGRLVIACRFMPGTRLPLYVASGALGHSSARFAFWTFVAAAVWTPLLVLGVAVMGDRLIDPLQSVLGRNNWTLITAVVVIFAFVRLAMALCTSDGRVKLRIRVERLRRYEFWPAWLFYMPLVPYFLYLTIRYRGLTTWTAANPGIPQGGVVGESKFEILLHLPSESVVPTAYLPTGQPDERRRQLLQVMAQRCWRFPVILKPDAGQRGAGVRLISNAASAEAYLRTNPAPVIAQVYHPGPYEAGVFYCRIPGQAKGRIFSITDKAFPEVIGDGQSTIEALILKHPRYRLQAPVFLTRHADQLDRVLREGEAFRLAIAGNHCQGTLFRDGAHLLTPELEHAVDQIARHFDGFYIGRFDIRYSDSDALRAGREFAVVELNGVTSESTNMYDPYWSLLMAYRTAMRQWRLVFHIGYLNRRQGRRATDLGALIRAVFAYYRNRQVSMLAD